MHTSHVISEAEHQLWYEKIKSDPKYIWYIYENKDLVPEGIVNFRINSEPYNRAEWGFFKNIHSKPGTGTILAYEGLNKAIDEHGIRDIYGNVKKNNIQSIKFHLKMGFKIVQNNLESKDTNSYIQFEISHTHWNIHKNHILLYINNNKLPVIDK